MAKTRSPNRDRALEIYIQNKGNIKPREIAQILNENVANIRVWKTRDEWDKKIPANKGGAPRGNLNSLKHGLYCNEEKRLPEEYIKKILPTGLRNTYNETANLKLSKLEVLGHDIDMLWAKILNSQKITVVKNKNDITKELKKRSWGDKSSSEEFEIQFAWDKENKSLDIHSKAMERLAGMIDKYEKLLHANWDLATEEQKLRIDKLNLDISKLSGNGDDKSKGNLNELLEAFKKGPVID